MQVWGQGFAPPSFTDEFAVIRQQAMGVNHKKVWLRKRRVEFEAMFWRCTDEIPERIRTVYRPVANEWRNDIELQLYIDYWEAASGLFTFHPRVRFSTQKRACKAKAQQGWTPCEHFQRGRRILSQKICHDEL